VVLGAAPLKGKTYTQTGVFPKRMKFSRSTVPKTSVVSFLGRLTIIFRSKFDRAWASRKAIPFSRLLKNVRLTRIKGKISLKIGYKMAEEIPKCLGKIAYETQQDDEFVERRMNGKAEKDLCPRIDE